MDPRKKLEQIRQKIKLLAVKADLSDDEAKELQSLMDESVKLEAQVKALDDVEKADEEAKKKADEDRKKEIADAVKAAQVEWNKNAAKGRRLPYTEGDAPIAAKFADLWKYDNLNAGDMAVLTGVLMADSRTANDSENAKKALAIKLGEATKSNDDAERRIGLIGVKAALRHGGFDALKADEIMQQDLTGGGDEWVGVTYSQSLWEQIRTGTFVAGNLPSIEVPQGSESYKMPIDTSDVTFYKVAETTDENATTKTPNASITSSKFGTSNRTIDLAKMGARTEFSGEFSEDSLIPVAPYIRQNMSTVGAEQMEHAIIDGDTATGASTNINDIAGTPAGTEVFLLTNGFRKLPLVTNTANSRDAGGLTAADFLDTMKLLGLGGKNALDRTRCAFIVDLHTYWKSLEVPEVKTRDVFVAPTIENGELVGLWGYRLYPSAFMHAANQDATYGLKAQTNGKIDLDTAADNTTGSILAVRWDRWMLGYKRRMTIESVRIPRADITEIVAMMRWGLINRDNEASAISYDVTV